MLFNTKLIGMQLKMDKEKKDIERYERSAVVCGVFQISGS